MKKNPNYKWAQRGHNIWKVLRTHVWTKLTFSVLTNVQCCVKPWDCPSPTHHCLRAAAAVLACRPFAALSAALAPLQLPGSKKTCSRVSTWDWWGSRKAYSYLFPLHTAPGLLPFLLLPSLASCSPASPSSLMSMFSIKLTSNGGWGTEEQPPFLSHGGLLFSLRNSVVAPGHSVRDRSLPRKPAILQQKCPQIHLNEGLTKILYLTKL